MTLGNGGFFSSSLDGLIDDCEPNFFTTTDVKTIGGRNIVKNFLGKISFELGMFGYSDSSMQIIDFYEECKQNAGMVEFFTNPVIRMIQEEMCNFSGVKMYLNDRIFDEIKEEQIKCYENTFNNNDDLYKKNQDENQIFMEQKENERKAIKKIQKENKCTEEQAREIYQNKNKQIDSKKNDDLFNAIFGLPSLPVPETILQQLEELENKTKKNTTKRKTKKEVQIENDVTKTSNSEIKLDDNPSNTNDLDNFWNI